MYMCTREYDHTDAQDQRTTVVGQDFQKLKQLPPPATFPPEVFITFVSPPQPLFLRANGNLGQFHPTAFLRFITAAKS